MEIIIQKIDGEKFDANEDDFTLDASLDNFVNEYILTDEEATDVYLDDLEYGF